VQVEFTEQQAKYLEAIEWLLDNDNKDYRQSGRSYLMACAFISIAIKNPNKWIRFFDHHRNLIADELMLKYIKSILASDKKLLDRAEFIDYEFRIISKEADNEIK